MIQYKIEQLNGNRFILKVLPVKEKPGSYELWYKRAGFFYSWKLTGLVENINAMMEFIFCHFGFATVVERIA